MGSCQGKKEKYGPNEKKNRPKPKDDSETSSPDFRKATQQQVPPIDQIDKLVWHINNLQKCGVKSIPMIDFTNFLEELQRILVIPEEMSDLVLTKETIPNFKNCILQTCI